jgi:hypothetical protein
VGPPSGPDAAAAATDKPEPPPADRPEARGGLVEPGSSAMEVDGGRAVGAGVAEAPRGECGGGGEADDWRWRLLSFEILPGAGRIRVLLLYPGLAGSRLRPGSQLCPEPDSRVSAIRRCHCGGKRFAGRAWHPGTHD